MSLLPKKGVPQEWQDQPIPGLEMFEEAKPREKSKKDEDDAEHKISYRRYRGARSIACHDCAYEGGAVRSATYVRTYQGLERYLCSSHAQHRRDMSDNIKPKGN
jgi:hypothetical protein